MTFATLCVALMTLQSAAQTLTFTRPGEPEAGGGAASLAQASALEASADGIEGADAAARVRAGIRRFAASLLRTGDSAGSAGSERVIAGMKLAAALETIDAMIQRRAGVPHAEHAAMLEVAAIELRHATARVSASRDPLPRVLRGAIAPLAQLSGEANIACCDKDNEPRLDGLLEALAECPGLTDAGLDSLAEYLEMLNRAEAWVGYRCAARQARKRLDTAAQTLLEAPVWLSEAAKVSLGARFDAAMLALGAGPDREPLEELALWGRVLRLADALSDTGASHRHIREALERMLTRRDAAGAERARLEAFERAVALCHAQRAIEDERVVIRQLRPAWRALARLARASAAAVNSTLPDLLRDPRAMSDPAHLTRVTTLREHLRTLDMVRGLSRDLSANTDGTREPVANETWARAADRVLRLAQQVDDDRTRPDAIGSLRVFARCLESIMHTWGEQDLRAVCEGRAPAWLAEAWELVTDDKSATLLAALETRRAAWRMRCGREGLDADAEEALVTAMVVSIAAEAAWAVAALRPDAAAGAMPGWFVSRDTARRLSSAINGAVSGIVSNAIDGNIREARTRAERAKSSHATARLMGRIEQAAHVAYPASAMRFTVLGLMCDADAWNLVRADIAVAARYAEEARFAAADRDYARVSAAWSEAAAERVLEAWNRLEPVPRSVPGGH